MNDFVKGEPIENAAMLPLSNNLIRIQSIFKIKINNKEIDKQIIICFFLQNITNIKADNKIIMEKILIKVLKIDADIKKTKYFFFLKHFIKKQMLSKDKNKLNEYHLASSE